MELSHKALFLVIWSRIYVHSISKSGHDLLLRLLYSEDRVIEVLDKALLNLTSQGKVLAALSIVVLKDDFKG